MRVAVLTDETTIEVAQRVAQRRFLAVFRAMSAVGMEPHLVTLRGKGILNESVEAEGYSSDSLGLSSYAATPLAVARFARVVRERSIDVVHSFEVIPAIIGGAGGGLSGKSPLRIYFRSHSMSDGIHATASRVAARLNDLTMGGSNAVIECALRLDRSRPEKTCVCLNGVVPPQAAGRNEIQRVRDELEIERNERIILVVSRLRKEKGVDVALHAVGRLARSFPDPLRLIVVGSGTEETHLRSISAAAFPARVDWMGHRDDTHLWYTLCDVVAVPSRREAFGLVAAEASSHCRPVVATRVGGLPQIVEHGVSGLLVDADDPVQLAAALRRILADVELRESMGRAGAATYRRLFTMEQMVARWQQCYLGAANSRKSSRPMILDR